MYQGSKVPHRPERCRECQHGIRIAKGAAKGTYLCAVYHANMATNKRGEPWRNWVCPRYAPPGGSGTNSERVGSRTTKPQPNPESTP